MFTTEFEIFQHFASCITKAIPEPDWKSAYLSVAFSKGATIEICGYYKSDNKTDYDFDIDEGAEMDAEVFEASIALYKFRQTTENDEPFNKYKFILNNDGTFDIEFKYDEDFAYMNSLDADSKEFDELLELDVTDQIESWEGLPQDHSRPWLQQ